MSFCHYIRVAILHVKNKADHIWIRLKKKTNNSWLWFFIVCMKTQWPTVDTRGRHGHHHNHHHQAHGHPQDRSPGFPDRGPAGYPPPPEPRRERERERERVRGHQVQEGHHHHHQAEYYPTSSTPHRPPEYNSTPRGQQGGYRYDQPHHTRCRMMMLLTVCLFVCLFTSSSAPSWRKPVVLCLVCLFLCVHFTLSWSFTLVKVVITHCRISLFQVKVLHWKCYLSKST